MELLNMAAKIALRGNQNRTYFVGCVVKRKDGAIVTSTNEMVKVPTPQAHAEARTLRKSDWGCTLYVARITRDGDWAMSRPCPSCQAIIINRGVRKVYYTISPGEYGVWNPRMGRCMKRKFVFIDNKKIGFVAQVSDGRVESYKLVNNKPVLLDSFEGHHAMKFAKEMVIVSYQEK